MFKLKPLTTGVGAEAINPLTTRGYEPREAIKDGNLSKGPETSDGYDSLPPPRREVGQHDTHTFRHIF